MIGIAIILIPLLIYVAGAFSVARRDVKHPDDFFVAFKRVGVTAFSSSSIAYAFQVGTIYPFLLWGASGFYFIPIVNTVCWGLGIFLFYLCFDRYKRFIGKEITLHGFLGEQYGFSVRVVASWLTIIAFLGFAIAETYFGSRVLLSVISDKNIFYCIVAVALLFVYCYIAYGGQVSSIRTDQLQLIMSYIGVFGVLLYFMYLIIHNAAEVPGMLYWSLLVLGIYILAIFLTRKFQFIKLSEDSSGADKWISRTINILITVLFSAVLFLSFRLITNSQRGGVESKFFNIEGFGIPGLLSLIVLPLCFQFVDLSNWQRLLSVRAENLDDTEGLHKNIKKGLLTYAVESPFTWLIFVFFGLLTVTSLPHFTFQDLLIDLPKKLIQSGDWKEEALGYTFIVSVLAIMLSSIDSFIMGIIFTFAYDAYPKTRKILDSKDDSLITANYQRITAAGRLFGLIAVIAGILFFVVFDKKIPGGGELFINLLLSFYAAQLSFFPHVFGILFLKKHPSPFWANASMIAGAVLGISVGVYAVIAKPEWAWYPILVCFCISSIIYLTGYFLKQDK